MGRGGTDHPAGAGDRSRSGAGTWNSLGTVLGGGRRMAEAEHAFGEAVKREPTNGLYRYNHGLALQQLGRRDDAMTEFRQAAVLGYRGQ